MAMTTESAEQFGKFTAGQVGKQVAFVRGCRWSGAQIGAPIAGQVLQLSGDLNEQQAKEIARMLRERGVTSWLGPGPRRCGTASWDTRNDPDATRRRRRRTALD